MGSKYTDHSQWQLYSLPVHLPVHWYSDYLYNEFFTFFVHWLFIYLFNDISIYLYNE